MARVIACVNSKGGVGKSTIAYSLATYWEKQGKRVLIIDGDDQQNCTSFTNARRLGYETTIECMSMSLERLPQRLAREKDNYDVIIIDTHGNLLGMKPSLVADVVVMPVTPSPADYMAFTYCFAVIKSAGAAYRTLLQPSMIKTKDDEESILPMLTGLAEGLATVSPVMIHHRVDYRKHLMQGLSIVDAQRVTEAGYREIKQLADHIEETIDARAKEEDSGRAAAGPAPRRARRPV